MTKPQKPKFDNLTKPGDPFQTFKPNAAMQQVLKSDFEKLGFKFGPDGKVDLKRLPGLKR